MASLSHDSNLMLDIISILPGKIPAKKEPNFILIFNHLRHNSYFTNIHSFLAGNYMFKANNRNTRTRSEICSTLKIKTPEQNVVDVVQL